MDIPRELVEAIAGGNAVLFVGAGLSRGAGLPGWAELLAPLMDAIELPERRRRDLVQAAQDFEIARGRQALLEHVRRATDTARTEPTAVHRRLPDLGIDSWVTTNYDDLLERTLRQAGRDWVKVVHDQDLPHTRAGATTVLKLHGDRDATGTIVLTRKDYERFFSRSGLVRDKLRTLLAEKTVLFVGYGIGDRDFGQLWTEIGDILQGHQRPAFAVMFDLDPFERADLHDRGIRLLHLETGGRAAYSELLDELLGDLLDELIEPVDRARPAALSLHQIPPPPRDFTGRQDELAGLARAVEQGATLLSLHGLDGMGKTSLAHKLASTLEDRYPDAQLEIDMQGARPEPPVRRALSAREAMARVIRPFRRQDRLPEDETELRQLYLEVLRGQRVLLLLDDARDQAQVEPLIPPEGSAMILTSRLRFTLPGLYALNVGELSPEDAEQLLIEIAPRLAPPLNPPRTPTEANVPSADEDVGGRTHGGDRGGAAELARLCGYVPQALRTAGSALAEREDLDVQEYLDDLRAPLPMGPEMRLGLVEASLSASYNLLDEVLQQRWRSLALFAGTFDRAAAASVWDVDPNAARDALSALLRYSLLKWDGVARRYRLHDLARVYADARLGDGERAAAGERHAAHYERVLRAANDLYLQGGEGVQQGLALFDLEWPNVEAGQAWAATHAGESEDAARLCSAYPDAGPHVLDLRVYAGARVRWLTAAAEAATRMQDRQAQGRHLGRLGNAYADLGQARLAIDTLEQALAIDVETGNRVGEGVRRGSLGLAYLDLDRVQGDVDRTAAIDYLHQALAIAQEVGDRGNEGIWLGSLGNAYADLGQARLAVDYLEQALAVDVETGSRRGEGVRRGSLGLAYRDLGELSRAVEYLEQALAIAQEVGDRRNEGIWLSNLGSVYGGLGEGHRAGNRPAPVDCYRRALAIAQETGDRRAESSRLVLLGSAYRDQGDLQAAVDCYRQALSIDRELGDRRGEGVDLANLGLACRDLGRVEEAIRHLEASLDLLEAIEDPRAGQVRGWLEELQQR